jgi:hypothetical protein
VTTTLRDRAWAATGALFVILILLGNAMNTAGTSADAHPTGETVIKDLAHQAASTSARAGLVLEVLGFTVLLGFLGYLASALRRSERTSSGYAGTAVAAGITMLAIKLGSGAFILAAYANRADIEPGLARVLNDTGGALFVISWLPTAVLVGAAAMALYEAALIGRPTAAIGAVLGVAGVVLMLAALPDATSGSPIAFLLALVWILVVSIRLAVRPGVGTRAGTPVTVDRSVATPA